MLRLFQSSRCGGTLDPRGNGARVGGGDRRGASYVEHMEWGLACRGCETACPPGVQYGTLVEAGRAEIENSGRRPFITRLVRRFVFGRLLQSPTWMTVAGAMVYLYQASGLQALVRGSGLWKLLGVLGRIEQLAPSAEPPFFFSHIGK